MKVLLRKIGVFSPTGTVHFYFVPERKSGSGFLSSLYWMFLFKLRCCATSIPVPVCFNRYRTVDQWTLTVLSKVGTVHYTLVGCSSIVICWLFRNEWRQNTRRSRVTWWKPWTSGQCSSWRSLSVSPGGKTSIQISECIISLEHTVLLCYVFYIIARSGSVDTILPHFSWKS